MNEAGLAGGRVASEIRLTKREGIEDEMVPWADGKLQETRGSRSKGRRSSSWKSNSESRRSRRSKTKMKMKEQVEEEEEGRKIYGPASLKGEEVALVSHLVGDVGPDNALYRGLLNDSKEQVIVGLVVPLRMHIGC